MNNIKYWSVDPELKKEAEDNYRTKFALSLKDREAWDIAQELTFDGKAPGATLKIIEDLFSFVEKNFLKKKLKGVGLELGSGPGVFSAILARRKGVEKVYGLELCANIIEVLMPPVVKGLSGGNDDKVVGCVGDFNKIELPENSVDFIFEFFSLHHSDRLGKTLEGCARILKPGGVLFAFDKARPDDLTDGDLEEMRNKEYGDEYKMQFGIPVEKVLRRYHNGEYEYRLREWRAAFLDNGFSKFKHYNLAKCNSPYLITRLVSRVARFFPPKIQPYFTAFIPKKKRRIFGISGKSRIYTPLVDTLPKEISLMIAYK